MGESVNLMTFMATSRDPEFLFNVIHALGKMEGKRVGKVFYLIGKNMDETACNSLQHVRDELKNQSVKLEEIKVDYADPSSHSEILRGLVRALGQKKLPQQEKLCINITAGTPAMSSVWMTLKALDFFGGKARFYSAQKEAPRKIRIRDAANWLEEVKSEFSHLVQPGVEVSFSPVVSRKEQKLNVLDFDLKDVYARTMLEINGNSELAFSMDAEVPGEGKILRELEMYCKVDGEPILVLGERGVGKSVTVEKYVPKWKGKEVVVQNCGAWNENLVGPMLFGSTGSAFTGDVRRDGLLKNAKGKVIFLDEVHHMPKDVQRQLLRTLQDRQHRYTVVGSSDGKELTSEGTEFIFASNKPLDELKNDLYPDFFDRISVFMLEIPPLRKRKEGMEKRWKQVWNDLVEGSGKIPKDYWTDELKGFLEDDANIMGNYRSLQILAKLIMAWWDSGSPFEEAKKRFLKYHSAAESSCELSQIMDSCCIEGLSKNEAEKEFKKRYAQWAEKRYGSLETAAEKLKCSVRTLKDARGYERML